MAEDPTRRRVLAAGGLAVVTAAAAGCSSGQPWPWAVPPREAPDVAVLDDAITAERSLIARYETVLSALPALAATAAPLLRQHRDHLAQLRVRLVTPGGRPSPSPSPSTSPSPPPASRAAALRYLRSAELAQAAVMIRGIATATPSLAQLLASIGASEAAHATVLGSPGAP